MYAEVIVDISASAIDKIFDYDISGFDVSEGYRVNVPFGNFVTEGFVVRIKENTNYDKNKVKKILSVKDDFAVINPEMIQLLTNLMNQKSNLNPGSKNPYSNTSDLLKQFGNSDSSDMMTLLTQMLKNSR